VNRNILQSQMESSYYSQARVLAKDTNESNLRRLWFIVILFLNTFQMIGIFIYEG
jgi:hypothetical protein